MNLTEVMKALEEAGTAQNRKVYARHGVGEPLFGVSYAVQEKLAKALKGQPELASALWDTGNHDARVLATKIADPDALSSKQLQAWARQVENPAQNGALGTLIAKTRHRDALMARWKGAKNELLESASWALMASRAMSGEEIPDAEFLEALAHIEAHLQTSRNGVRYNMNNALIAIGIRNPVLRKAAFAAAKRIGKVEVDHGETGCKTPEAIPYIERAVARKKKK